MSSIDSGDDGEVVADVVAPDAGRTFVDELYAKFLECRLCSRTYRLPKVLVCQHTFCADCLETHYEMDEQDRPYRFLLSHSRDLSCPQCRARTPMPTGGVRRLPDNFLVANLADVIRRRRPETSGGGAGLCEICRPASLSESGYDELVSERDALATVKCLDCCKLMCAACTQLHRDTKVTSTHALFTLSVERDVECKTHRNETLRFYCEPCEQCICVLCALHDHNDHDVSTLSDGLERHRGTFDALLADCRSRIDAVREQLTLTDAFKTAVDSAEERVRASAIDAIAAVRRRERDLLDALRATVGGDALRFIAGRDSLGARLAELDGVRELTEALLGRTSVEMLMAKKEVRGRLRAALERPLAPIPSAVRDGGVRFADGVDAFGDLHQSAVDTSRFFRHPADDQKTRKTLNDADSESETESESSESDEERATPVISVAAEPVKPEHVSFVPVSSASSSSESDENSSEDDSDDDDDAAVAGTVTKICIDDGVVKRMIVKSQSLTDAAVEPPPPKPSGRKIPDFSRPKPKITFADRGTSMDHVETADAATATQRVLMLEKETSTGYVTLVHKNVSTDNQGTEDKSTSTVTDVTAAYRNISAGVRPTTVSRGTTTLTPPKVDRGASPVGALRSDPSPTAQPADNTAKASNSYPTVQRVTTSVATTTSQKPNTSSPVDQQPVSTVGQAPVNSRRRQGLAVQHQVPPATAAASLPSSPSATPGPATPLHKASTMPALTTSTLNKSQNPTAPGTSGTPTAAARPQAGNESTASSLKSFSAAVQSRPPAATAQPTQNAVTSPSGPVPPVRAANPPTQHTQTAASSHSAQTAVIVSVAAAVQGNKAPPTGTGQARPLTSSAQSPPSSVTSPTGTAQARPLTSSAQSPQSSMTSPNPTTQNRPPNPLVQATHNPPLTPTGSAQNRPSTLPMSPTQNVVISPAGVPQVRPPSAQPTPSAAMVRSQTAPLSTQPMQSASPLVAPLQQQQQQAIPHHNMMTSPAQRVLSPWQPPPGAAGAAVVTAAGAQKLMTSSAVAVTGRAPPTSQNPATLLAANVQQQQPSSNNNNNNNNNLTAVVSRPASTLTAAAAASAGMRMTSLITSPALSTSTGAVAQGSAKLGQNTAAQAVSAVTASVTPSASIPMTSSVVAATHNLVTSALQSAQAAGRQVASPAVMATGHPPSVPTAASPSQMTSSQRAVVMATTAGVTQQAVAVHSNAPVSKPMASPAVTSPNAASYAAVVSNNAAAQQKPMTSPTYPTAQVRTVPTTTPATVTSASQHAALPNIPVASPVSPLLASGIANNSPTPTVAMPPLPQTLSSQGLPSSPHDVPAATLLTGCTQKPLTSVPTTQQPPASPKPVPPGNHAQSTAVTAGEGSSQTAPAPFSAGTTTATASATSAAVTSPQPMTTSLQTAVASSQVAVASPVSTAPASISGASGVAAPGPPSKRGGRVLRSMSMENVSARTTAAQVWRLPPPIMSTSVAAVTQRLNSGGGSGGGGGNGGGATAPGSANSNGWRPTR